MQTICLVTVPQIVLLRTILLYSSVEYTCTEVYNDLFCSGIIFIGIKKHRFSLLIVLPGEETQMQEATVMPAKCLQGH